MNDYRPIDCGRHSDLELAIMHGKQLRVRWQEPGQADRIDILRPCDLLTRQQQEFLVAKTSRGELLYLRLDRITGFTAA